MFSQSAFKITKEKVRFLRPEVAVVDISEEVMVQRGPETGRELPPRCTTDPHHDQEG